MIFKEYIERMEDNKKIEISKMGLVDQLISALKALVSIHPFASPMLSLFSDYQNQKQMMLIEDVLNRFLGMIEELDNRVKDLEYMSSSNFIYDVLQTSNYAKDEQDEYRRKMLAKYLTSCCLNENSKNRNKRIFLDLLVKMDELDYYILKNLDLNYKDRNAVEDVASSFKRERQSDIRQREVLNHFYYLTSLGIIEMPDQEEVDKFRKRHNVKPTRVAYRKERIYQRTTLGDDLYNFISKAETE